MPQILFKNICYAAVCGVFIVGCGNVRFSASPSTNSNGEGIAGMPNGSDSGTDPGLPGGNGTGIDPGVGVPTPTPTPAGAHTVNYNLVVPPASNKVDFLLVIDNSTSMAADQQKLAAQMKGFADKLATLNIDWQMCLTTTTFTTFANGAQYWGHSLLWKDYNPATGSKYVLRPMEAGANLNTIFVNTIAAIGVNETAGDERGIKSAYNHLLNGSPGNNIANSGNCYRKDSAIAVIVLSDEDERSIGGDQNRIKANKGESIAAPSFTYRPLEDQDLPQNLLSFAKGLFGQNLRFTFNSIVVDSLACENAQDSTPWVNSLGQTVTSASHMGLKYIEMSNLTAGGIGSICSASFQNNLNLFTEKLTNTLKNITLECAPSPLSSLVVKVADQAKTMGVDFNVSGAALSFVQPIAQGTKIDISYTCP